MADITVVQELSIYCRWMENGAPVGNFREVLPGADAEFIYSVLIEWLGKHYVQCHKLVGIGFNGVATFAGKRTRVQAQLKDQAPHFIFINCHCHKLQLACVQAAPMVSKMSILHLTLYGNVFITHPRDV